MAPTSQRPPCTTWLCLTMRIVWSAWTTGRSSRGRVQRPPAGRSQRRSSQLCARLGLRWDPAMMRWTPGRGQKMDLGRLGGIRGACLSGWEAPPAAHDSSPAHLYELHAHARPYMHLLSTRDLMAKYNQPDPRNEGTQCWVDGLVPQDRRQGPRLRQCGPRWRCRVGRAAHHRWTAIQLEEHLDRLLDFAHALAFADIPARGDLRQRFSTPSKPMACGMVCIAASP